MPEVCKQNEERKENRTGKRKNEKEKQIEAKQAKFHPQ
jgi:hypothetical protein